METKLRRGPSVGVKESEVRLCVYVCMCICVRVRERERRRKREREVDGKVEQNTVSMYVWEIKNGRGRLNTSNVCFKDKKGKIEK